MDAAVRRERIVENTAEAPHFAALSEQVCHLLNTNDHLSGGVGPLKPPPSKMRLTVRCIFRTPLR